jgi:NAD(P)-dependent dehydrogenase (short-subunit alcohol dehydrogenase family)
MKDVVYDLSGQTAIVTGGGTGIGQAIAIELARAGVKLTICSRNMDHLEATKSKIKNLNRNCLNLITDVRYPEQVNTMVNQTLKEYGRIDILVNNAGANFFVPPEKMSANAWNTIIAINLTGTFQCCKAVFETMLKQKGGKIINVSSTAGRNGDPRSVHYGAAKAGINNLTKSLAREWGKFGIRVNAVAPGPIVTEGARWWQAQQSQTDQQITDRTRTFQGGLERPGKPEEVAYAVLFLASEASSYINGVILDVDGGA